MTNKHYGTPIKYLENEEINFEYLYECSILSVLYVIKRVIKDEYIQLDIAQETYIKAFKNINKLEIYTIEAFCKWCHSIALNCAKDFLRKKIAVPFTDVSIHLEEIHNNQELTILIDPSIIALSMEKKKLVLDLIESLPEEQKTVIYMHYFSELTTKEIAEQLEQSESTIKSRLKYAKVKMLQKIYDSGDGYTSLIG